MSLITITLEFDTEDLEDDGSYNGRVVTRDEIEEYAETVNLDTARAMVGYQGYRIDG